MDTTESVTGGITRRDCLQRSGLGLMLGSLANLAPLMFAGCDLVKVRPPRKKVKVGLLHSQTGKMAISETALRNMELFAIEEINEAGGVLGFEIDPVVLDGRSSNAVFSKQAKKLLEDQEVVAVFGCWTSSSRKAVLPIFEESDRLLFYPVQYEGNESSKNIIYTGATPNQQILPAIDWLLSEAGGSRKRIALIGSDYIFPRTANLIINTYLHSKGIEGLKPEYLPLKATNEDVAAAVGRIVKSGADAIFSTINGETNIEFYRQLLDQGITADKVPVIATSVGEEELRNIRPVYVQGHYAAWSYFQSIDSKRNQDFVSRFQREYGYDRVIGDPMEAAYTSVYLWKQAVEKAGNFETANVRKAIQSGIPFEAPGGTIHVDPKTQHTFMHFRLGRIRKNRQFDIVHQSNEPIAPEPYPQFVFPGWHCDWTADGLTRGPEVLIGS